jgi:hypothetical protein
MYEQSNMKIASLIHQILRTLYQIRIQFSKKIINDQKNKIII